MLKFFSRNEERPADIKEIRHQLLLFIKDQLRKAEGGEGSTLKNICLYLAPAADERHLYEAAVYYNEPGRLKNEEVQRIADDYAIDLPTGWEFIISFEEKLPEASIKSPVLPASLSVSAGKSLVVLHPKNAVITILRGGAEYGQYKIHSGQDRFNIGRDKMAQTSDGFGRVNFIAFPSTDADPASRFISRQHAHIVWDDGSSGFVLYADEGGIPPRNKVKVQEINGRLSRLQTTEIGHVLKDGDQIVLGESVLMEFHYLTAEDKKDHE